MHSLAQKLLGQCRLVLHDQRHYERKHVERVKELQFDGPLTRLLVQMIGDQLVQLGHKQRGVRDQIEANADGAIERLVAAHQIVRDHSQIVVEPRMRMARVLAVGAQFVKDCGLDNCL